MIMGTIESGNPSYMPIVCGSKTDSQGLDQETPEFSWLKKEMEMLNAAPFFYAWSGLARHLAPLPSAAVRSSLIFLFTEGSKERWEG